MAVYYDRGAIPVPEILDLLHQQGREQGEETDRMLPLILAAILGGLIVFLGMKFAPKKPILKLFLKMLLVVKDSLASVMAESLEKFKDLLAESRAEHEAEKRAKKQGHTDAEKRAHPDEK